MFQRNLPNIISYGSGGGGGTAGPTGPTGPSGSIPREAFCVTLDTDFSAGADGYNALFPLTSTPDTTAWPAISGETIFNNLTLGSFDNSTGIFTCGVSGDYILTTKFVANDLAFPYDGVGLSLVDLTISVGILALSVTDNIPGAQVVSLIAGRAYQMSLWIDSTDPPSYLVPKSNAVLNIDWPRFLWGMALVAGGSGGGGGGGVQSVGDGVGITISGTSTDPIVNNAGVLTVVAGTNVTVDNTDPQNPIVSATSGSGGEGFRAYMPVGVASIGTGDTITGNWSISSSGAGFDLSGGAWNFTTGVYTTPVTGIYLINAQIGINNLDPMDHIVLQIGAARVMSSTPSSNGNFIAPVTLSTVAYATAGEQIFLFGISTGGVNYAILGSGPYGPVTWFSVWRLG